MFSTNQNSQTNEKHLPSWTRIMLPFLLGKKHHASIQCKGHIITHGGHEESGPAATFLMTLDLKKQSQTLTGLPRLPKPREGHTMCLDRFDNIVVFGGMRDIAVPSDKLEIIKVNVDQEGVLINPQQMENDKRVPLLTFHTANVYQNDMYVFGGMTGDGKCFGDIWVLNLDTLTWRPCVTTGGPGARVLHVSAVHEGKLYIFGGVSSQLEIGGDKAFDDFYVLDLENMQWKQIEASGTSPGPRVAASMQEFRGNLLLFGGISDLSSTLKTFNDLHMFCIKTNTWTQIQTYQQPPPRYGHTSVIGENKLYILGGINPRGQNEFDVWYLDLDNIVDSTEHDGKGDLRIENEPFCLIELFTQRSFTDIVLEADGKGFPAHKAILSQRCKFFENLFNSGMSDSNLSRLSITDAKADTFETLLRFIYSDPNLTVDEDMAFELLALSDKYLLPTLKTQCERVLNKLLSLDNFVKIAKAAEMVESDIIKDAIFQFTRQNINILKERGDLYKLSQTILIELFANLVSK